MSVRGERIVYREREREVDTYEEPQRRTYTTVKRYQVPDRDSRTAIFDNKEDTQENKLVIRRERREDHSRGPRSEIGERSSDRGKGRGEELDVRITERTSERDSDRRDVTYRIIERDGDRQSNAGGRSEHREREREFVRAPSPPAEERVREYRFERERDYSPARTAVRERDYDVERYSKTTDYYGQPQPIIIRESAPQPIIIREERRGPQQIIIRRDEPAYEIIEREEVRQDQQLVVKDDPPPPASTVKSVARSTKSEVQKPQEEDYYFERRIQVRRNDDIKPSDSASQYSSDDSYEYVRRERYVDDESDHHKRHLAEGALAGAAAGAILRQHRKSQGKEDLHGSRNIVGGAALGALGAEAISRARSLRGSSRRREWDDDDDRRSRRDRRQRSRSSSRSRSRSRSKSRIQKLGGLAAVAAVGALAGYAIKKSGQNKETVIINGGGGRHRSRSRRRRSSVGSGSYDENKHNPEHRNRRIAQAGLASAAAAGIWERMRSKSRGGRERSKSRVRTGLPIVGAGLGGAALAGLYERNKASKEGTREQIIADERNRGRNRSRSRSSAPYDHRVQYGNDPVRRDNHYDEAPGSYRRRDRSGSGSPDNRTRSRSRKRTLATAGAAAAAGAAGTAIAQKVRHSRSRSRSRNADDRDRRDEYDDDDDDDRYSNDYPHGDYMTPPAAGRGYPSSNYFPPPPTGEDGRNEQQGYGNDPYPPYNPADYPPAAAGAEREPYEHYDDSRYPDPAQQTAEARERQEDREMRAGRESRPDPGNVSSPSTSDRTTSETNTGRASTSLNVESATPQTESHVALDEHFADNKFDADRLEEGRLYEQESKEGQSTPRARSTSRVRFDLDSNVAHSPDDLRRHRQLSTDRGNTVQHGADNEHRVGRSRGRRPSSTLMNDPYERQSGGSDSEETIDLPPRFDEQGNRKVDAGNDLASRLNEMFGGSSHSSATRRSGRGRDAEAGGGAGGGMIEQILHGIATEFLHGNDDSGRPERRSRR